jgi:hypothetical protein
MILAVSVWSVHAKASYGVSLIKQAHKDALCLSSHRIDLRKPRLHPNNTKDPWTFVGIWSQNFRRIRGAKCVP